MIFPDSSSASPAPAACAMPRPARRRSSRKTSAIALPPISRPAPDHHMTALRGADVDAYVSRPNSRPGIALICGPDSGLVRERVAAILGKAVDDLHDPFSLARIEGD